MSEEPKEFHPFPRIDSLVSSSKCHRRHNCNKLNIKVSVKLTPGEIPRRPAMQGGGVFLRPPPYGFRYDISPLRPIYIFFYIHS